MNRPSLRDIFTTPCARRILATALFALSFSHHAVASNPPAAEGTPPAPASYQLVGVAKFDGISYASIIDLQTGYHLLLSTIRRSDVGLFLASVATDDDPSGPSVTLRKDGATITLALWGSASFGPTAKPESQAPLSLVAPAVPPSLAAQNDLPKPPPGTTLPLVFEQVDPQKMTLTPEQSATLTQLRQDFINDLNGAGSAATLSHSSSTSSTDATSPAAGNPVTTTPNSADSNTADQNWVIAQQKSDAMFRMLFGTQAFNAYTESSSYPTLP